eukprot:6491323-Amphidinium_carterae.3
MTCREPGSDTSISITIRVMAIQDGPVVVDCRIHLEDTEVEGRGDQVEHAHGWPCSASDRTAAPDMSRLGSPRSAA